jgi:hypothetical protein
VAGYLAVIPLDVFGDRVEEGRVGNNASAQYLDRCPLQYQELDTEK